MAETSPHATRRRAPAVHAVYPYGKSTAPLCERAPLHSRSEGRCEALLEVSHTPFLFLSPSLTLSRGLRELPPQRWMWGLPSSLTHVWAAHPHAVPSSSWFDRWHSCGCLCSPLGRYTAFARVVVKVADLCRGLNGLLITRDATRAMKAPRHAACLFFSTRGGIAAVGLGTALSEANPTLLFAPVDPMVLR